MILGKFLIVIIAILVGAWALGELLRQRKR